MHVYQMRSSVPAVVSKSQERIDICMRALNDVSKVWLVAKMVHTLFESILGNKALEERLQKATGKRQQKIRRDGKPKKDEPLKRKFDELEISLPNGPPAPQVSYERSHPQTPAASSSREWDQPPTSIVPMAAQQASPHTQQRPHDAFLGAGSSGGGTRPTSPFNPSFTIPASPPDLFLVTRNSPNISQALWENFQPDQLFPDGTNMSYRFSPPAPSAVDPQLQMPPLQGAGMPPQPMGMGQQQHPQQHQQLPSRGLRSAQDSPTLMHSYSPSIGGVAHHPLQQGMGMQGQQAWPIQALDGSMAAATLETSSQDDNWSTSSRGQGPMVPPTLNVEDWYVQALSCILPPTSVR